MRDVKVPVSKSYRESLIAGLRDPQESAAFIEAILEEKDPEPELLRVALQDVAEALGTATLSPNQAQQHLERLDRFLSVSESSIVYELANWLEALGLKLTVSVGDNLNINATNSVVLQAISGTATNTIAVIDTINQLSDAPAGEGNLKELLTQLQAVLEDADEAVLPDTDKADALEQVKLLAEAAQKPEEEKKTLGAKAIRFLQGIVGAVPAALPIAATLVTEFNKLVPAIGKLLGL